MSRVIEDKAADPEEEGGTVTTVKANESKDLDFQARLKQMRIDAGELNEDGSEKEAPKPKEEKPAAAAKKDDPDWQESLTPEQKAEVNRVYKEKKRSDRMVKELTTRLEQLEAKIAEKPGTAAPEAQQRQQAAELKRPTKPDPLTFKGTAEEFARAEEKYEDDLYDYRKQKDEAANQAAKRAEADKLTVQRFNTQVEKFSEAHEDYAETMDDADNEVSDLMFGAIVEEGPALGYYFAKNPEESAKIARMGEKEATKAILRVLIKIEDGALDKKPDAPAQKKDEPIAQVRGRGPAPQKDRSKMTFKEKEAEAAARGKLNYTP